MKENLKRVERFKKDEFIERNILFFNKHLKTLNKHYIRKNIYFDKPIVFIMGLQRSGTTLLFEFLYRNFDFVYPDHIVARFWNAPFLGVLISQSIRKDFEKLGFFEKGVFESVYGVTKDVFGGHEFGYFWKNYFGFMPHNQLSEKKLKKIEIESLKKDLSLMMYYGKKPLLFKVVPLSFNADFLCNVFPNSYFVFVKRDLLYVAQSTYIARKERYGNYKVWWSIRPKEYFKLRKYSPLKQIAGQVYFSKKHIDEAFGKLPKDRKIVIHYEDLCANPKKTAVLLRRFLPKTIKTKKFVLPQNFKNSNMIKISKRNFEMLKKYLNDFAEMDRKCAE